LLGQDRRDGPRVAGNAVTGRVTTRGCSNGDADGGCDGDSERGGASAAHDPNGRAAPLQVPGVVRPPRLAEDAADLADRAARAQRLAHRDEQVPVADGRGGDAGERRRGVVRVALCTDARRALALAAFGLGVDAVELHLLLVVLEEAVD